ncbi:MAG: DUF4446 family protein [Candidatus Nealsonbacteria bacterium]|nr:DUF4446 family protein [Candidatus Nealsonbacteria bacterium]
MFNLFKKGEEPKDFKDILKQFEDLEKKVDKISQEFSDLKKKSRLFVQKVGMVRYNPFSGVGGDQSFSIALLDANNNGVIITGIYNREGSRVYAKPIKDGQSEYSLSDEEKEAISKSLTPNN